MFCLPKIILSWRGSPREATGPAQQAFSREFVEKVGTRAKKKRMRGEGEGSEGNGREQSNFFKSGDLFVIYLDELSIYK